MAMIRFAALDGAKANFGIAKMLYDTETGLLSVEDLILIQTKGSTAKTVRKSSDTLRRAQEIAEALKSNLKDCAICFGEVPSGGKSASAVHAFGIVVGLYASLSIPFSEVSPLETKRAAVGTNTASKEEMITWATEMFPDAPWLRTKRNGVMELTRANEHIADAVAVGHAGVATKAFQQMVSMAKAIAA